MPQQSNSYGVWPANYNDTPISPTRAQNLIDMVLRGQTKEDWNKSLFKPPPKLLKKPELISRDNSNMLLDMVAYNAMERYPEAADKVGRIFSSGKYTPGAMGVYNTFTRDLNLNPSNKTGKFDRREDTNTMLHELAHAQGLEHWGKPSAYDIGDMSDIVQSQYEKDIRLPLESKPSYDEMKERKKGLGPSWGTESIYLPSMHRR